MKLEFKKIFRIALILMLVAGIGGVIIVCLNMITEPIIEENEKIKEQVSLQEIYDNGEFVLISENVTDTIESVYEAKVNDNIVGYVYKVSGKNAYGTITLLVGINNSGNVQKVVIMENTQSFASTVKDHIKNNYQNEDINLDNVSDVDTKCGATYGAKLVKSLISDALNNFKGGQE